MEGASQDASREAYSSLEDSVLAEGAPDADGVKGEAPSERAVRLLFSARLANSGPRRPRLPNQLILGMYVLLQKVAQKIIDHKNPFNKRESSVTYMCDLYPTLLRVLVVARVEEYSIPFPGYLHRKSNQCKAEDGMLIRNHDLNESAKLVCFDF